MRTRNFSGLSLLELLAVLAIMGVLAVAIIPRLLNSGHDGKIQACKVNCHTIEIQAMLWKRQMGSLPTTDLSDLSGSERYFPEGLPVCPVDGSDYRINIHGRVIGHDH